MDEDEEHFCEECPTRMVLGKNGWECPKKDDADTHPNGKIFDYARTVKAKREARAKAKGLHH